MTYDPHAAKIRITVSAWNSGCLPELLRKEIESVERHRKIAGANFTGEEHDNIEVYLNQLRACALAVREARV